MFRELSGIPFFPGVPVQRKTFHSCPLAVGDKKRVPWILFVFHASGDETIIFAFCLRRMHFLWIENNQEKREEGTGGLVESADENVKRVKKYYSYYKVYQNVPINSIH